MNPDELAQAEFVKNMANPMWRLNNLYKIIIKRDGGEESLVIQFKLNRAQRRFVERLHFRNIILKARQLGFTTLIAIMWLDYALFTANARCGIIAQDDGSAQVIFRDKVKFAYDNLPEHLKAAMPLKVDNAHELVFAHNNSSVRVATSMRSGTIHRLHVSEFGKICAKFPDKAIEVMTGSIQAVPQNGVTVIESTAEGAEGAFYDLTNKAMKLDEEGRKLTNREWRFHFFPWWQEQRYRMDPEGVVITDKDHEYFELIEAEMRISIEPEQRAWYVATREADFISNPDKMKQEYPSTPKEAFEQSNEGCYYAQQMTQVRKQGRILRIPALRMPVNTFWDIGNSDGCGIWFHQQIGMEDRFIKYIEAHGEDLTYYMIELQKTGYLFNKHFLPHDAMHERLSAKGNKSIQQQLKELGLTNTVIVPRIQNINEGIQLTRQHLATAYFDVEGCKLGISRLDNYKKKWNDKAGRWSDEPVHDANSEGADSFRQFAQAKDRGLITMAGAAKAPNVRGFQPSSSGMGMLG